MPNCFVIMPFKPELHYMYLYLQQHIEKTFQGVSCERGDAKILTVPLLDKVVRYIQEADVIIADCTGRNPNVFYELGMAHALNKPVILITNDQIADAPTDIRAFEFIRYELDDHKGFLENLDKALNAILGNQFDALYAQVSTLFDEFRQASNLYITKASKEEFTSLAAAKVRSSGLPSSEDQKALAKVFLPIIVEGPAELDVMLKMGEWIEQQFGS